MSGTPDELETLLRTMKQDIQTLRERKTWVPTANPTYESIVVDGDVDVTGSLAAHAFSQNGKTVLDSDSLVQHGVVLGETNGTWTVKLDSGVTLPEVRSLVKQPIWTGQRVLVSPDALGHWLIYGRRNLKRWRIPPLIALTGARDYGAGFTGGAGYLTGDGIAVLQGLIIPSTGAIATGTTLFTLPTELKPDIPASSYIRFPVNVSDLSQCIDIYGDGTVKTPMAISASNYIALTNIIYPTAAAGFTWTAVAAQGTSGVPAFANSWLNSASAGALNARWSLDSYGILWVQGLITNAGTPTTATPMIALPASMLPWGALTVLTVGNGGVFGFASVDTGASGHNPAGINWVTGSTFSAGGYQGLGTMMIPTAANTLSWSQPTVVSQNSWANSGGIYPTFQMAVRRDIALLAGLVTGGTIGSKGMFLPPALQISPVQGGTAGLIQNRPSNAARGRLDIWPNGDVIPQQGSNVWFSLDSFGYIVE